MTKVKIFLFFSIYLTLISLYFSYYLYSKQNELIVFFLITLVINVIIALINKHVLITTVVVNMVMYTLSFFMFIANKQNYELYMLPKAFGFYFLQYLLSGNWMIPMIRKIVSCQ